MSELLQIQRALQNHLRAPDLIEPKTAIDSLIVETERVPRAVRLHIYANAYRARIVEALSADFGMLHAYLGDVGFSDLVHAYIDRYPSHYFSLRGVGSELANFLRTTAPYAEHVELHELAEFEWALCHAFDAADTCGASSADFAALKPEQWTELRLHFTRSLRVLKLHSNAPAIWKMLNSEQAPPAVEISAAAQYWMVWRHDLKLLFRPLDAIETIALNFFMTGAAFADVCGELAENLPVDEVPPRAAMLLQQWLQDGVIAAPLLI